MDRIYIWFKKTENKLIFLGIVICIIAFMVPIFIWAISNAGFSVKKISILGPVGDFLGGTTVSLLSFASILFILATIVIQRNEIKNTQEELYIQKFESSLLNMINQHSNMINNFELVEENIEGKKIFGYFIKKIDYWYIHQFDEYVLQIFEQDYNGLQDIDKLYKLHLKCRILKEKKNYELPLFRGKIEILKKDRMNVNKEQDHSNLIIEELFLNLVDIMNLDPNIDFEDNIILKCFEEEYFPSFEFKKRAYEFANFNIDFALDSLYYNFTNIIRFIESYKGGEQEVLNYVNMFISQLSAYEIYILKLEAIFGLNVELQEAFKKYDILARRLKPMGGSIIGSYRTDAQSDSGRIEWLLNN